MTQPLDQIGPEFHERMQSAIKYLDMRFNGTGRPKKVGLVFLAFPARATHAYVDYATNAPPEVISTILRQLADTIDATHKENGSHGRH